MSIARKRLLVGLLAGLAVVPVFWVSFELGTAFNSGALAVICSFVATIVVFLVTAKFVPTQQARADTKLLAFLWSIMGAGQLALAIAGDKMLTFALAGGFLAIGFWQVKEFLRMSDDPQEKSVEQ